MDDLPSEIKELVASFLSHPQDLATLALTSSSYLFPAQWNLYRKVTLKSNFEHLRHTFDLLRRQPKLRNAVRALVLNTAEDWDRGLPVQRWVDMTIFDGMSGLLRLEFRRLPCVPAKDFQDTFATIYSNCPRIKEIVVTGIFWPSSTSPGWVLDSQLNVPSSLKKITFESSFSSEMRTFFRSTFIAPYTRIEFLELFADNNRETVEDISSLRFESLKSLRVVDFNGDSSHELVQFLLHNPTIESLSFPRANNFSVVGMKVNVLPKLRSISGPPSFIVQLAKISDSVKLVNVLDIDFAGCERSLNTCTTLVWFLGGFPNLKHLSLSHTYSPSLVVHVIKLFQDSKELEWWSGGFYCRHSDAMGTVTTAMSAFLPTLKRVDICEWTTPSSPLSNQQREELNKMAAALPSLNKLCLFYNHLHSNEMAALYQVQRDQAGNFSGLIQSYQHKVGGPYKKDRRRIEKDSEDWSNDLLLD